MKGFGGFGNSPMRQEKKAGSDIPTASDTLGAYTYQNYPSLRNDPKGGAKIKAAHEKLKGHKVTEEEMRRSSKSYLKNK